MAKVSEADPCRVLFRSGCVNALLRERVLADPHHAVWWPEEDADNKHPLRWLALNAPGFVTEVEIEQAEPGEQPFSLRYEEYVRMPTPEIATAFVEWIAAEQIAWAERHALVPPGDPYCVDCGGPLALARRRRDGRISDVEFTLTAEWPTCIRCGEDADVTSGGEAYGRFSDLILMVRAALGIPRGKRVGPSDGPAQLHIDATMATTDAEFRSALGGIAATAA